MQPQWTLTALSSKASLEAKQRHALQSVVGLVWRALLLWMLMLALLSFSVWV
jgi:hypothetical protein